MMMTTTQQKPSAARRPSEKPGGNAHLRTCAGCGVKDAPAAFVRVVLGVHAPNSNANSVVVDVGRSSFGRGAHVHPRPDCLVKACKSGLSRAFKVRVQADPKELAEQIVAGCERRMEGLLVSARRAGHLAIGADAVCEALEHDAAGHLRILVACDAGTIIQRGPVASAVAKGRAIAWGSKETLGRILKGRGTSAADGRDEVAVVAVLNAPLASELAGVFMHADACRFFSVESTSEAR